MIKRKKNPEGVDALSGLCFIIWFADRVVRDLYLRTAQVTVVICFWLTQRTVPCPPVSLTVI